MIKKITVHLFLVSLISCHVGASWKGKAIAAAIGYGVVSGAAIFHYKDQKDMAEKEENSWNRKKKQEQNMVANKIRQRFENDALLLRKQQERQQLLERTRELCAREDELSFRKEQLNRRQRELELRRR